MVEIVNLTHSLSSSKKLFNGMNLSLSAGSFYTFCGPSGCGKSTLLRLIAGLIQPSQGRIKTDKVPALMFQDPALLPWRTVRENLELVHQVRNPLRDQDSNSESLRNPSSKEVSNEIDEYLELVKLLPSVKELFPHQLSGGMKARVAFVRALIATSDLLLLDEPFSALDEITRLALHQDLRRIHSQKKMTTILVTHSIPEAVFLSDEIFVLNHSGEISSKLKVDSEVTRDLDLLDSEFFIQRQSDLRKFLGEI